MPEPIPDPHSGSTHWRYHVTDRLQYYDRLLAEFLKYRTAMAVIVQTGEHMPVLDTTDLDEIKNLVSELYYQINMQTIEEFIA